MTIRAKYSGGPNRSAKLGERRREQNETEDAEGAGDEGGEGGNPEGGAGSALTGHLVAIETGDDR